MLKENNLRVTILSAMLTVGCLPPISGQEIMAGPPAQYTPGKAPPIPMATLLAQPRTKNQTGHTKRLIEAAIPPDNSPTPDKIELGFKLFFDGRLSADGTVACATCHDPGRAFTDGRPASIGINGRGGQPKLVHWHSHWHSKQKLG